MAVVSGACSEKAGEGRGQPREEEDEGEGAGRPRGVVIRTRQGSRRWRGGSPASSTQVLAISAKKIANLQKAPWALRFSGNINTEQFLIDLVIQLV
jgi:hypothetical protein